MTTYEHNVETGEIVERELTAEELKQLEADKKTEAAQKKALLEKESAKSALLDRLGITADEAKLLLG